MYKGPNEGERMESLRTRRRSAWRRRRYGRGSGMR